MLLRARAAATAGQALSKHLTSMMHSTLCSSTSSSSAAARPLQPLARHLQQQSIATAFNNSSRAAYTCSSALFGPNTNQTQQEHVPQLPRHVARSVAAKAPTIKHQWDSETAKQVWCLLLLLCGVVCMMCLSGASIQAHTQTQFTPQTQLSLQSEHEYKDRAKCVRPLFACARVLLLSRSLPAWPTSPLSLQRGWRCWTPLSRFTQSSQGALLAGGCGWLVEGLSRGLSAAHRVRVAISLAVDK